MHTLVFQLSTPKLFFLPHTNQSIPTLFRPGFAPYFQYKPKGLGLDEFSVGAASILPTRAAIAGWGGEAAAQLAEAALACSTDGELAALLETACGD